jgi:hypothetical protein
MSLQNVGGPVWLDVDERFRTALNTHCIDMCYQTGHIRIVRTVLNLIPWIAGFVQPGQKILDRKLPENRFLATLAMADPGVVAQRLSVINILVNHN